MTVTVCDVCKTPGIPVERYEVKSDSGRHALDLCEEHSGPLRALLEVARVDPGKRAAKSRKQAASPSDGGARRTRRMTIEEIEAGKAAGEL